ADHEGIGDLAGAAGMDDVLQVGAQGEPGRDPGAVVDFGDAFVSLDAHAAGQHAVAVALVAGQARVGAAAGDHERDHIVVAAGKSTLVVAAEYPEIAEARGGRVTHAGHRAEGESAIGVGAFAVDHVVGDDIAAAAAVVLQEAGAGEAGGLAVDVGVDIRRANGVVVRAELEIGGQLPAAAAAGPTHFDRHEHAAVLEAEVPALVLVAGVGIVEVGADGGVEVRRDVPLHVAAPLGGGKVVRAAVGGHRVGVAADDAVLEVAERRQPREVVA